MLFSSLILRDIIVSKSRIGRIKMNTDKIYAESIANEYSEKDTSKVVALKMLDRKAKRPSLIFAYIFGTVFALILGLGMCLCMGQIGTGSEISFILGIVIGLVGIVGCSVDYPIFKVLRKKGKEKHASEIMDLAKQIAEEN